MYSKRNLAVFFAGTFLVFINFFVSLTVLPPYLLELGGTEFQSGLQNTVFFMTAVLLRFYFGPLADRRGRKIPLLVGAFVFASAPGLFWFSSSVNMLLLSRIYQAIGLAAYLSAGSSLAADLAPQGRTGVYLGFYRNVLTLAILVGPSTALYVINQRGYGQWFLLSLIIGLFSCLLLLPVKTPKCIPAEGTGAFSDTFSVIKIPHVIKILTYIALTSLSYGALLTFVVIYITQVTAVANPGIFFSYFGLAGLLANVTVGYLSDRFGYQRVAGPILMILGAGNIVLYFLPAYAGLLIVSSLLTGIGVAGSLLVFISWLVALIIH
ncbi:MFS transporter [Dethiobacter alkaliphilus]|uniref:MFS transporter n=1 Tax=Dethiobacter alkaliphilus TaxID=427926 RepID=UPI0022265650|nr:MFS transporter [Dethiobacter alkaliphilus]MCW3489212.1 MFS transporter [Dethiobacter alkaliphilus]